MTSCKFLQSRFSSHYKKRPFGQAVIHYIAFYLQGQIGFQHLAQGSHDLQSVEMVKQGDDQSGDRNPNSSGKVQVSKLPKLCVMIHFQSYDSTFILPDKDDDSIGDYMLQNASGI